MRTTPWGEIEVSDAHCHFFSRQFYAALGAQSGKTVEEVGTLLAWQGAPQDSLSLARAWTDELDRQGVSRAALIASIPGDEQSVLTATATAPERFYAYAMVNPLAQGARVAAGLHAVCFFPAMHGYFMHDPRVEPLLEQAAAQGCAVFVHCGALTVGVRRKLGLPSPFDMRYSNPIDLHGTALRYSKLRFIVPHFGAGYFREALMLADLCPNVYLDTSSSNSWMRYCGVDLQTAFKRALEVVGPGRLLFGTDSSFFPRGWNAEIFETQCRVLAELGVSAPDARRIFGGNLTAVLATALRESSAR